MKEGRDSHAAIQLVVGEPGAVGAAVSAAEEGAEVDMAAMEDIDDPGS